MTRTQGQQGTPRPSSSLPRSTKVRSPAKCRTVSVATEMPTSWKACDLPLKLTLQISENGRVSFGSFALPALHRSF